MLKNMEASEQGQDLLLKEISNVKTKKPKPDSNINATDKKVFKKGDGKNHPDSTTHDTSICRESKAKGGLKGGNKDKIKDPKVRTWAPCEYCLAHPNLAANAASHSSDRCFRNPASPNAKPNMIPKNVNLVHQMDQLRLDTQEVIRANQELVNTINSTTKP